MAREPGERRVGLGRLERVRARRQGLEVARREGRADARQFHVRQVDLGVVGGFPLGLDLAGTTSAQPRARHQHLDPRLVDVVAPAVAIVDPHDRLQVRQQVARRQVLADGRAQIGRAPQPAAHQHLEAQLARLVAVQPQPDVVDLGRRPVLRRSGHRDLELARQERELGVEGRPLPHRLDPDAWIVHFLRIRPGVRVGGDVADVVAAAGLDRICMPTSAILSAPRMSGASLIET